MSILGIIGAGNMGSALAKGLKADNPERRVLLYDIDSAKTEIAAGESGGEVSESADTLISSADIIVIAIKPQQLEDFFRRLSVDTKEKKFISIAAGTKIDYFRSKLGSTQIIRFMPNLAATISAAVVGVAVPTDIEDAFEKEALSIAQALGTAVLLPEEKLAAITGLSGSGIAYVFAFLHAMALGGTQAGISYDTSLEIAEETLRGALEVLKSRKSTPGEMLTKVASAGGTTIEGIRALEEGGLTPTVMDAIGRAADRAEELEK